MALKGESLAIEGFEEIEQELQTPTTVRPVRKRFPSREKR